MMHPNPIYHDADRARNIGFARERGFGVLAVNAPDGPLLSHVPFLLNKAGDVADLHLVRSNPIVRLLKSPQPVRLAVTGPDCYVSPDWYEIPDQVPTWNYVAVQMTGSLELRPQDELPDFLARQSAFYEARLAPKPAWKMDKLTDETRDRLMRMIVPCRLSVTGVDGTWKLGQNKPAAVRAAAADHMSGYGFGSEPHLIAALMLGQTD